VYVFLARQVQYERPMSEDPQVVRKSPRRPGSETNRESSSGDEGVSPQGTAALRSSDTDPSAPNTSKEARPSPAL
jgi:hypothetical protein